MDGWSKGKILALISNNQIAEAIEVLSPLTEHLAGEEDLHAEVVLQSANWNNYEKDKRIGTQRFDTLEATRKGITNALVGIVNQLPPKAFSQDFLERQTQLRKIPKPSKNKASKPYAKVIGTIAVLMTLILLFVYWFFFSDGYIFQPFLPIKSKVDTVLVEKPPVEEEPQKRQEPVLKNGFIKGRVYDSDGQGLAGVLIASPDQTDATTDQLGYYHIQLGNHYKNGDKIKLSFSKEGYEDSSFRYLVFKENAEAILQPLNQKTN